MREVYARPVASELRRTHVSKSSHPMGPMSSCDLPAVAAEGDSEPRWE